MLATEVVLCEDGHAQERALLGQVLPLVEQDDLWIADRNLCTVNFLFGIAARGGGFVIRQHGQLQSFLDVQAPLLARLPGCSYRRCTRLIRRAIHTTP